MKIKFRVWNGEWMISPDYIDCDGIAHWKENSIPQSSNDLMQYTGLRDKQGEEIYEGDIVKGEYNDSGVIKFGAGLVDASDFESFAVEIQGFYIDNGKLGDEFSIPSSLAEC